MKTDPLPDFTEHTVSSRCVYQGRLLRVHEDQVLLPDGHRTNREYIRHPGAVMILAMLSETRLLLERQYRYPAARHFYELPAGKLEPGEDPLVCAQRELLEETGYVAESWTRLATTYPCVGYSDERIELFLARGLRHEGAQLDHGEFLQVLEIELDQAMAWVRDGTICDVKTMLGLFWADRARRFGW